MSNQMSDEKPDEKKVKLWDFPVRLFHWSLVAAIVTAWWTNRELMIDIHAIAGYTVLALVLFRIIWALSAVRTRALHPLSKARKRSLAMRCGSPGDQWRT